jgi:hypothetical protein
MSENKSDRSSLSFPQMLAMVDAMRAMGDELPKMSMVKLCAELRGRIDFAFSEHNVRSALSSIGVKLVKERKATVAGQANRERIKALEALTRKQGEAIDQLADTYKTLHALAIRLSSRLKQLENDLGVKAPSALPE